NDHLKAIPYYEYALSKGQGLPLSVHYDLGMLYARDENLPRAVETLTRYRELAKADKKAIAEADAALKTCYNAMAFMSVPRDFKVHQFDSTINSEYTEYNPVVSADESVMAFTGLRPNTGKTRTGDKFIEEVYISYTNSG